MAETLIRDGQLYIAGESKSARINWKMRFAKLVHTPALTYLNLYKFGRHEIDSPLERIILYSSSTVRNGDFDVPTGFQFTFNVDQNLLYVTGASLRSQWVEDIQKYISSSKVKNESIDISLPLNSPVASVPVTPAPVTPAPKVAIKSVPVPAPVPAPAPEPVQAPIPAWKQKLAQQKSGTVVSAPSPHLPPGVVVAEVKPVEIKPVEVKPTLKINTKEDETEKNFVANTIRSKVSANPSLNGELPSYLKSTVPLKVGATEGVVDKIELKSENDRLNQRVKELMIALDKRDSELRDIYDKQVRDPVSRREVEQLNSKINELTVSLDKSHRETKELNSKLQVASGKTEIDRLLQRERELVSTLTIKEREIQTMIAKKAHDATSKQELERLHGRIEELSATLELRETELKSLRKAQSGGTESSKKEVESLNERIKELNSLLQHRDKELLGAVDAQQLIKGRLTETEKSLDVMKEKLRTLSETSGDVSRVPRSPAPGVQITPSLGDGEEPERCCGYLWSEGDQGKYSKFYYVLDVGMLGTYVSEGEPGSMTGQDEIEVLDLAGCTISFPGRDLILLQPSDNTEANILFQETNIYEYNKWEVALHQHLSFANPGIKFSRAGPVKKRKNGLGSIEEDDDEDDETDEYTDRRGIKYETQSQRRTSKKVTKYESETLEILREQLRKDGKTPLEFIPLEEIKTEISGLFEKANNGSDYDEGRLDYLLTCMDLNPQYKAEKEAETKLWRAQIGPYTKECLRIMRGFVPPHIFSASLQQLTEQDGLPLDLAKRVLSKRCLWLIRVSTADIGKMHIAELQGRFNPEAQGLDIVEMAAIFANIPEKFMNDDAKGTKEKWRMSIEECVKNFYQQMKNNTLAKAKQRLPLYKGLTALYSEKEEYYKMQLTVGDAFGGVDKEALKLIKRSTM